MHDDPLRGNRQVPNLQAFRYEPALLHVRRGAAWGRVLRVLGYVVFFPLSMAFYLTSSWFTAPRLFVAQVVLFLLGALVLGAMAVVRRARRNGAARQDG